MKKIKDLNFDNKNANKGTKRGASLLEKSISDYGLGRSILIDRNGKIIAGNKTAEMAGQLGIEDIEIIKSDGKKIIAVQRTDLDLDKDEKARKLAYADNRVSEIDLEWDLEQISKDFQELDLSDFWNDTEIDDMLKDFEKSLKSEEELDEVEEVKKEAVSKLGDLFLIDGRHRVLCGDSTSKADVERLMDGKRADMCITDPPYNVDYEGKTKDALKIENDKFENTLDFQSFLSSAFKNMHDSLKEGGAFYIWHADSEGFNFRKACLDVGLKVRQCLVWVKNSMVLGRQDYHWQHEPCLYGWKDGAGHNWYSDRKQTTVLNFTRPSKNDVHPTMKPVSLIAYQIKNNSKKEQIIFDLFLGSGTTLIACEETKRICYGMELEPLYIDVILRRYKKLYPDKEIKCLNREFDFNKLFEKE